MKRLGGILLVVFVCAALATCGGGGGGMVMNPPSPMPSDLPFWAQWGANPQHAGMVNVAGQAVTHQLADIVYDPFVAQEQTESLPVFGAPDLVAHFQATITDGNDDYMMMKTGHYTPCSPAGDWANGTA